VNAAKARIDLQGAFEPEHPAQLLRSQADVAAEQRDEAPVAEAGLAAHWAHFPAGGVPTEPGQRHAHRRMRREAERKPRDDRLFEELELPR